MPDHKILSLLAALATFTLVACGPAPEAGEAEAPTLIVAMEPDKDPDAMLEDRRAIETYLSGSLEHPVEAVVPLSATVIYEGLQNGTIDIAYLSATAAARLAADGGAELLMAELIDGQPSYQSYWIALQDAPYSGVADLKGQPVAFSSRTSTSGFLIPVWDLYQQGLIDLENGPEGFFGEGNVFYGVGYVSAAERVLSGRAEAAAVSYYVLDRDKYLSTEQRARLKRIDSQGPVPSHVIVARSGLDPNLRERLKASLLKMNTAATGLRDRLFGNPLAEVDPVAHLDTIQEALDLSREMRF